MQSRRDDQDADDQCDQRDELEVHIAKNYEVPAVGMSNDPGSYSPSHRAMTTVARQLPRTFNDVRSMSSTASMPRMTRTGSTGNPNDATVPRRMTSAPRGTPATPLLESISVTSRRNCC